MLVLIGIPTHKRPDLLRSCLESIARQEGNLPPIHVFVADNDPNDRAGATLASGLADEFRFPLSSTVVAQPGISAVRNVILNRAQSSGADFIAMIDDDEMASPAWLSILLQVRSRYAADVVGGPSIRQPPPEAPKWLQNPESFGTVRRPTGPVDYVQSTSNVLITCKSLAKLEWPEFDDTFGLSGGGDAEYFFRLRKLGLSFAWADDATVEEPVPPSRYTTGWFIRRHFRYGNSGYRFRRLHGDMHFARLTRAMINLAASPIWLVLALFPALRSKALRNLANSAGVVSSMAGYRYLEYAERHGPPNARPPKAPGNN